MFASGGNILFPEANITRVNEMRRTLNFSKDSTCMCFLLCMDARGAHFAHTVKGHIFSQKDIVQPGISTVQH